MDLNQEMGKAFAENYPEDGLVYIRPLLKAGMVEQVKAYLFARLSSGNSDEKWQALQFFYFLYGTGATGVSANFGDTREEMVHPSEFTQEDFVRLLNEACRERDSAVLDSYSSVIDCISSRPGISTPDIQLLLDSTIRHLVTKGGAYARERLSRKT